MNIAAKSAGLGLLGALAAITLFVWMHFGGDVYAAYVANAFMACF